MSPFVTLVALVGIVILVASLLSGLLDRSRLPVVAVFLALGLVLGPHALGLVDIRLESPELQALATLGLALVLFSDAVTLDIAHLRRRKPLLFRVLGPGTLAPALAVTVAARFLLDLSWPSAALIGAALASTDPVLLRAVVRSPALPEGVRTALRMETGMNDIVLLPIVILSMLAMGGGAHGGAGGLTGETLTRSLLGLFLLGPVIGALVGWLGISALVWIRDRLGVRRDYESLYALGLAFTAYAAAEAFGGSGFVAAFVAGLMVAARDVELCDCFLEYGEATAEMLLLLTFVALGTTLIWTGLDAANPRTLLFALIALGARTVVLYPVLGGLGLPAGERRLIALLGARGLSSLLLVLLPVFAGVPGAERLFAITCLVVLISVVVHGGGIALFHASRAGRGGEPAPGPAGPSPAGAPGAEVPLRILFSELDAMIAAGEPFTLADVRKDKAFAADPRLAAGAVRLDPDAPARDAKALRLSQRGTLVVYCG